MVISEERIGEDMKEYGHYLMFYVCWRTGIDENHEKFIHNTGCTGRDL